MIQDHIRTIKIITGVKMEVTPELSERVQKVVLKNLGSWNSSNRNVMYTNEPYLYITAHFRLEVGTKEEIYLNDKREEIQAEDFLKELEG